MVLGKTSSAGASYNLYYSRTRASCTCSRCGGGGGGGGGGQVVRWCWVKLPVLGHPTICITVGQGPPALAVGAGRGGGGEGVWGVVWTFLLSSIISPSLLSLPLFGRWPDID